ncbi:MAG: hypothetical protein IKF96_04255 [Eggerthellaceae bacterium]|nr:hypothetical protein [Eggerthellaceae bacterium]
MDMPVDIKKVLEVAKSVDEARNVPVGVCVLLDDTAPEDLLARVRCIFEPQSPGANVDVYWLTESGRTFDDTTDFVVVVAGGDKRVGAAAHEARMAGIPAMVVAVSPDYVESIAKASGYAIPDGDLLDGSAEDEDLGEAIGKWLLAVNKNKKLALAQAFACARRPLAQESIRATAIQNAGVGAVVIIPGADMPVMTLNQIKMLLQIAAAYGQPMDAGRVKELAAVVGGGFLARTAARELIGLVPVGGWAVKGGIGYSATMAMGYAALNYFEGGGGLHGVGSIATGAADAAVKAAGAAKKAAAKGKDAAKESAPVKMVAGVAGTVAGAAAAAGKKVAGTAGSALKAVKSAGSRVADRVQDNREAAREAKAEKAAATAEVKAQKAAAAAEAKAERTAAQEAAKAEKAAAAAEAKARKEAAKAAKPVKVVRRKAKGVAAIAPDEFDESAAYISAEHEEPDNGTFYVVVKATENQ